MIFLTACEDNLKSGGGCGGRGPKIDLCPSYAALGRCSQRYVKMKCPVSCGLCGSDEKPADNN